MQRCRQCSGSVFGSRRGLCGECRVVRVRYELDVRCPVVLTRDGESVSQYDRAPRAAAADIKSSVPHKKSDTHGGSQ